MYASMLKRWCVVFLCLFGGCSTQVPLDTTQQGIPNCTATTPSNEVCDGVDNDCNGKIDDDINDDVDNSTVCGSVSGGDCRFLKNEADLPKGKCGEPDVCSCLVTPKGQVFVCFGATPTALRWRKLEEAQKERCDGKTRSEMGNVAYCGGTKLTCYFSRGPDPNLAPIVGWVDRERVPTIHSDMVYIPESYRAP